VWDGAEPVAELLLDHIRLDGPIDVARTLKRTNDHAWRMHDDQNAANDNDDEHDDDIVDSDASPARDASQ
jgi:hypothetical protein